MDEEGKKEEGERRARTGFFLFADWADVALMAVGTLGAVGDGCSINCLLLFASTVMNSLGYGEAAQNADHGHADFMHDVEKVHLTLLSSFKFAEH